jgi:hypothetical protein
MDKKQKISYKLRAIKIGWLNEQMYHILLKRATTLNRFIQSIKIIVFIINVIASTVGENINYRWWTIPTSIIITFGIYMDKIKDEVAYGSKIELHRSMTDECIRFTDMVDSKQSDVSLIENMFASLIERSSKLHIDPEIFNGWEEEFKKRGIKEMNAFEMTDNLSKELDIIIHRPAPKTNEQKSYSPRSYNPPVTSITTPTRNKKADFELQRMFNDLNIKPDE